MANLWWLWLIGMVVCLAYVAYKIVVGFLGFGSQKSKDAGGFEKTVEDERQELEKSVNGVFRFVRNYFVVCLISGVFSLLLGVSLFLKLVEAIAK